ncbi:MAG: helix-turn-helix domain-containing protein, partial [Limisphaerales bacterium]
TASKYGIEISSFIVENVSVPAEVEQAIDKRSSMAAIGNLNDYVKFQMAQGIGKGDGGGTASATAQLGAGLALGQQMVAAFGKSQAASSNPAASNPGPGTGLPELLSPADAAKVLGVSEPDVLTALGDGSLKGKKIGAVWRITRSALDEFLKS